MRNTAGNALTVIRKVIIIGLYSDMGKQNKKRPLLGHRFDMSPDDMAEVLAVDRATFHRYRSGFVYGVAERLGWY